MPVFSDLVAFANDEFTVTAGAGSDYAFGRGMLQFTRASEQPGAGVVGLARVR